jgi:membrane dipeptidase
VVRFFIAMNPTNPTSYPIFVDSHEDLAWNMLTFQRDYTLSSSQIRSREKDTIIPDANGDTMLGWADYQSANVGLIFSTLFAAPISTKEGDWDVQTYRNQQEAHDQYQQQLDAYERLFDQHPDRFRSIRSKADLRKLQEDRSTGIQSDPNNLPIGLLTLMEGADCIRRPEELPEWVERGVRFIGLAWQATAYSGGTKEPGPLTRAGFQLLDRMEECGCVLDLSHMDEKAVWQALDAFSGRIMVSHSSPNALLQERHSNRFLKDEFIRALAERNGVMGLVPYNLFLDPFWVKGNDRNTVSINRLIEQIDYVCQLLGTSRHTGIGTDFDGGFGWQSSPKELNSIADMVLIEPKLREKGYSEQDLHNIFGLNWMRFLEEVLP